MLPGLSKWLKGSVWVHSESWISKSHIALGSWGIGEKTPVHSNGWRNTFEWPKVVSEGGSLYWKLFWIEFWWSEVPFPKCCDSCVFTLTDLGALFVELGHVKICSAQCNIQCASQSITHTCLPYSLPGIPVLWLSSQSEIIITPIWVAASLATTMALSALLSPRSIALEITTHSYYCQYCWWMRQTRP